MKGVVVETSCWPVVWIQFGSETSDDQLRAALATLSTLVTKASPHVLVFDVRRSGLTRPGHCAMQVAWLKEQLPELRKYVAGVCFLIESPAVQFTLSSVVAMSQTPIAIGAASTPAEAARWATEQLMRHGFRSPDLTDHMG